MLSWLNRPYPFLVNQTVKLALSMLVGLICFLFLLVLRPFGLQQVDDVTYIFGFGVIAFLVLVFHYFVFPKIFSVYFNEEKWTIGKQLVLFTSIITLTGIGIYIYNSTVGLHISPQYSLGKFIYFALIVGVLPITFMTYFIEKVAARRNNELADSIAIAKIKEVEKTVSIISENQNEENLEIKISEFVFAQANGNYTDIYYNQNEIVENRLMRVTLKSVEDQFSSEDQILRCHKSYLIHKGHIEKIEGNARSLVLKLSNIDRFIPISRSISKSEFE